MRTIESDAGSGVADRADPFTRGLLTAAGAAVLLGLAAVIASLVISVRIGRGLVVELVSLRNDALGIARHKLPEAMRRLRAGEEIDVRAEAPPGSPSEDEIGQVTEALGTVHRAALRAAVERAELASGISGVFVNLARRSQVLVHRQLSLLDSMERRSEDPNELSDLFRLDHLTTRMRRHAESLIILSGAAPGRAWRMPVSLTNVVRAAVSEVEDYARVEVRQLPEASVVGAAVADLTHLLAEIVENAAQFSPPHTRVRVTGEPVGNGYAVEVEDRGLGMGKESLGDANRRIEQSEALDLFDSDRLGLFVVSRLAARHGIKVHLRTSPYGGTTAVVLLPTALLHGGAAERAPRAAVEDGERAVEREYARVPTAPQHQESVPAPADRPALAVSPRAAAESANDTPPPGVTTLRLHRPPRTPKGPKGATTSHAAYARRTSPPTPRAAHRGTGTGTGRRTRRAPHPGGRTGPDGGLPRRLDARRRQATGPWCHPRPRNGQRQQRRRPRVIQDPSMRAAQRSGELDWLLDDLVLRVSEVRHVVVLSNDGLAVGASTDLKREDAEHLAAVASGFHSLAKGAGRHFGAAWSTADHGRDGRRLPVRGRGRRRLLPRRPHRRHGRHRAGGVRDGTAGQACRRAPLHAAARRCAAARSRMRREGDPLR